MVNLILLVLVCEKEGHEKKDRFDDLDSLNSGIAHIVEPLLTTMLTNLKLF